MRGWRPAMPRQAVLSQEQIRDLERDRRRKRPWEEGEEDCRARRRHPEGAEELSKDRREALEARRQRRRRRREEQARALLGGARGDPSLTRRGAYLGYGGGVQRRRGFVGWALPAQGEWVN